MSAILLPQSVYYQYQSNHRPSEQQPTNVYYYCLINGRDVISYEDRSLASDVRRIPATITIITNIISQERSTKQTTDLLIAKFDGAALGEDSATGDCDGADWVDGASAAEDRAAGDGSRASGEDRAAEGSKVDVDPVPAATIAVGGADASMAK